MSSLSELDTNSLLTLEPENICEFDQQSLIFAGTCDAGFQWSINNYKENQFHTFHTLSTASIFQLIDSFGFDITIVPLSPINNKSPKPISVAHLIVPIICVNLN